MGLGKVVYCLPYYSTASCMDWILWEVVTEFGGGLKVEYSVNGGIFLSYRDKTPLGMDIHITQYADDLALIACRHVN